jgi:NADH:ubiquinone oxidoreductase subunit 2 (subunit N)
MSRASNGLMLFCVLGGIVSCLVTLGFAVFYLFTGVIGLDRGWATSGRLFVYFLTGIALMGWGIRLALRDSI